MRNVVMAPVSLSPKSVFKVVEKFLNKYPRRRQQWAGGECSNNRQLANSWRLHSVSLLSVATAYQLTTTTHRPATRINTGFGLLNSQEANREQREKLSKKQAKRAESRQNGHGNCQEAVTLSARQHWGFSKRKAQLIAVGPRGYGGSLKYETASETIQKGIELFSI